MADSNRLRPVPFLGGRQRVWLLTLAAIGSGLAGGFAAVETGGPELVRGSALSVEARLGGAVLRVEASEFREYPSAQGGEREFRPERVRFTLEGENESELRAVEVPYGSGWLETTSLRARYGEAWTWAVDASGLEIPPILEARKRSAEERARYEAEQRARRAWELSPVRVLVRGEVEGRATVGFEIGVPVETGESGVFWEVTGESSLERSSRLLQLEQGKPVEVPRATEVRVLETPVALRVGLDEAAPPWPGGSLEPPPFRMVIPEIQTVSRLTSRRIRATGSYASVVRRETPEGMEGGFRELPLEVRWEFRVGEPPDVGYLEAVAGDGATWLPELGERREFRLVLTDPDVVEEVRFVLEEVSRHPGVAGNAGFGAAQMKGRGGAPFREHRVKLGTAPAELTWKRYYAEAPADPRDEAPDLAFRGSDHPGMELENEHGGAGAGADLGGALRGLVRGEEMVAGVEIADWAASGRIRAEVRIGGEWEDLRAAGVGLVDDGMALQFPIDGDGNGVPDFFEEGRREGDGDGDGLDLFAEYRGVLVRGVHQRLAPEQRDVFLFDYTGRLTEAELRSLAAKLNPWRVRLHALAAWEHDGEKVAGGAPLYVMDDFRTAVWPQLLRMEDAATQTAAWRLLVPGPGLTTLFTSGNAGPEMLSQDLVRMLDLPEFAAQP